MINRKLIELQKFKKNKRNVYVSFVNGIVEWKNNTYDITYKNVGGKMYPYVIVENIQPLSKIKPLVEQIIRNKDELKFVEYEMNNHTYYVTGIGVDAIKAHKDDKEMPKFFRYSTTEGQKLLNLLVNNLQTVFI